MLFNSFIDSSGYSEAALSGTTPIAVGSDVVPPTPSLASGAVQFLRVADAIFAFGGYSGACVGQPRRYRTHLGFAAQCSVHAT